MIGRALVVLALLSGAAAATSVQPVELRIRFVGNEGVVLTDGVTSLLVDLPYEPGASGYMTYDPEALDPPGQVVSLITHGHADHFDEALFLERNWSIIGPADVTDRLPAGRVIPLSEAVKVGDFTVRPHRTAHSDVEHYSYFVLWRGRRLYFVGDTENPSHLLSVTKLDVAFVTPWLGCTAGAFGKGIDADRLILYHERNGEGTRGCFDAIVMEQGQSFTLAPVP